MSALDGIRILELAESPAGEYCGKLLADFGAEVIKIERPGTGSPTRAMAPFGPGTAPGDVERSGLFAWLNTNKSSATLDLASDAGREALTRLLSRVDAVIDDHATGWLDALGLGKAAIATAHPSLVVCAITPFGQDPAPDRVHAEDLIVFHKSGWGYHTPSGGDPTRPPLKGAGRFMVSYEAALEGAMCACAALFHARNSGEGQFIDVSAYEVMASRVDYVLAPMVAGEADVSTSRHAFDLGGPSGIFPCGAGFVYIWMSAPAHWEGLKTLMGNPSWMDAFPANWLERGLTPERVARVRRELTEFLCDKEKHGFSADAQQLGLTVASVNDARDLQASPQYAHRGFFTDVAHPVLGRVAHPGVPYRLSATPAVIRTPAPLLGMHSGELA